MATRRQGLRFEMGVCRMVQWQPGCPFDVFPALMEGGGRSVIAPTVGGIDVAPRRVGVCCGTVITVPYRGIVA